MNAARLQPLLVGGVLVGAASRWPAVVQRLQGVTVTAIEALGKHLLIDLDDATTFRVHLGMKGRWREVAAGEPVRISAGDVSLRLDVEAGSAICSRAPTVERFPSRDKPVHRVLRRLGPDVLATDFAPEAAVARVGTSAGETAAEVLLDQGVACGIGNVYKSELLYVHRLDPFTAPDVVLPEMWLALYGRAATMMRANLEPGPRNTTGLGPGRPLHWVYGRRGRPCLRCGTRIQMRRHGAQLPRFTYWCPRCQR